MSAGHGVEVWGSPEWRADAVHWLDERLADLGVRRTGDVEQPHLRPWATALAVPTTRGRVWLKAAAPGTAFEVRLYPLLRRVVPDRVLEPIAVDTERGWVVLPDGGTTLGERLNGDELVETMATVLRQYGQLQRDLEPYVEDMLAVGVTDMRTPVLPERFDEALDAVGPYVDQFGRPGDDEKIRRVRDFRATYVGWCEQLAKAPGVASLDHNDMHAFNVLGDGSGTAVRAKFYDWGDCVVTHPFSSLLVALGFVQGYLLEGVADDDPRLLRLRDAYLEAFGDLGTHAELVETVELACRVAKVVRSLIWHRAVSALGTDAGDFASAPFDWLGAVLDDSYLGGAGS